MRWSGGIAETGRVHQRDVAVAWQFLGRFPWEQAVTLTVDPKRFSRPVRKEYVEREAVRWCQEVARAVRYPVGWLVATESGRSGLWHSHALLTDVGTDEATALAKLWEIRNGRTHVRAVTDAVGATMYGTKHAGQCGDVVVSDSLPSYRSRLRPTVAMPLHPKP